MSETKRPFPDAARLAEMREWASSPTVWVVSPDLGYSVDLIAVIDLAASLEWHDGSERPDHSKLVQVDTADGIGVARDIAGRWLLWGREVIPRSEVLRWRELPR